MIVFDLTSMRSIGQLLQGANLSLFDVARAARNFGVFTGLPSLSNAFTQYQSIFSGQVGSVENVVLSLQGDIQWLQEMFTSHITAFDLQDRISAGSFDRMNSVVELPDVHVDVPMPPRLFKPISNLLYATPVAVVEASTPLEPLITMFEGNDGAPMQMAAEWSMVASELMVSMEALQTAASTIAVAAQGYSFDAAREAITDVITLGRTVATNAKLMADSIAKFPAVRIANLAALRNIQATTATIQNPLEKQAVQQAAVANFVSSQLQPSLETLKPPVANFGMPVIGHTGNGILNLSTTSTSSQHTDVHTPHGGLPSPASAVINNLETGTHNAIRDTPDPSGSVAPASTAETKVPNPSQSASPVNATNLTSNSHITAPNSLSAGNHAPANPGVLSQPHAGQTHTSGLATVRSLSSVRGGVGQTSTSQTAAAKGLGRRPVIPLLPSAGRIANGSVRTGLASPQNIHPIVGGRVGENGSVNGRINSLPSAGNNRGITGNGGKIGGLNTGTHSYESTAQTRHPAMATGGTGGSSNGRAAYNAGNSTRARIRDAKTRAGIFGRGQWAPGVKDYFTRQFLGEKKRTVKQVIK
ncbi:hypothetical protein [Corynebacterium anserum]|uniref:Uncharacterized protein n=1 Tax=Corynebacterium anserum TaxID=2684406 RepID=A0A7G7YN79_9CORY|nr:hypothetical protein [Corynebacterium anserum]QNH95949.1 hypothetical protein GP473_03990 [Corynebacterium anserum]